MLFEEKFAGKEEETRYFHRFFDTFQCTNFLLRYLSNYNNLINI